MIYFDLETIPPPRTSPGLDAALTHRRDRRLTDAAKVAADREETYRSMSLVPIHGRILCAAWCVDDGPIMSSGFAVEDWEQRETDPAVFDQVERRILDAVFDLMRSARGHQVASYRLFDLHFLRAAAFRQGYSSELRWRLPGGPADKWAKNWLDLSIGWGDKAPPLAELGAYLGLTKDAGLTGAEVYPAFLRGEVDRIRAYCEGDVKLLREVGARMGYEAVDIDED
jgi:hypothetical protein